MPIMKFRALLLAVVIGLAASNAAAEPERVRMGEPLARFDKLQPGTNTYLRYQIMPDGSSKAIDLETKELRFEEQGGQRRVRIVQHWTAPTVSASFDSLFEDKTLRPITHQRDSTRDGKTKREGFRFLTDKVVGIADQPDNFRKDFEIATPVPAFNFEVDLETLKALPLRRSAEFEIVFYHPGGEPPAPYVFKVAGEEKLSVAGEPIDCWVVTTDYNRPDGSLSRFWLAKDSQTVVRVYSPQPDGSAVVKALLPSARL